MGLTGFLRVRTAETNLQTDDVGDLARSDKGHKEGEARLKGNLWVKRGNAVAGGPSLALRMTHFFIFIGGAAGTFSTLSAGPRGHFFNRIGGGCGATFSNRIGGGSKVGGATLGCERAAMVDPSQVAEQGHSTIVRTWMRSQGRRCWTKSHWAR